MNKPLYICVECAKKIDLIPKESPWKFFCKKCSICNQKDAEWFGVIVPPSEWASSSLNGGGFK